MSNKDNPAFPNAAALFEFSNGEKTKAEYVGGLTKREHFAALAMQGLLAAVYSSKEMLNEFTQEKHVPDKKFGSYITGCEAISRNAVSYADALLAELDKEPSNEN